MGVFGSIRQDERAELIENVPGKENILTFWRDVTYGRDQDCKIEGY